METDKQTEAGQASTSANQNTEQQMEAGQAPASTNQSTDRSVRLLMNKYNHDKLIE